MPESSVDQLREQLRQLGYLSHGIDRWYEHDPWRSRTFWVELLIIGAKNALLLFAFLAAPLAAITIWQNRPVTLLADGIILFGIYGVLSFTFLLLLTLLVAAVVRLHADRVVERPQLATATGVVVSSAIVLSVIFWWRGFTAAPALAELSIGAALLFLFLFVSTISLSAALLSLSIWAVKRVPPQRSRSQRRVILAAGAILLAVVLAPALLDRDEGVVPPPQQVVTAQRDGKLALIAVDGLTHELAATQRELASQLHLYRVASPPPAAPPELWGSIGTGVPPFIHGVRAVEGVRLPNSRRVLQSVSQRDVALRHLAPLLGMASREALPPTARNRDYVWETIGARGISSVAVNWWASGDVDAPLLRTSGQAAIFARAARNAGSPLLLALNVDKVAAMETRAAAERQARFVTLYLPALDVLLNRLDLDAATSVARSRSVIDDITTLVGELRTQGYEIVLVGAPGNAIGHVVIATTLPLARSPHLGDIAPTILDFFGFPASDEMRGSSLLKRSAQQRLATYGDRTSTPQPVAQSEEYYESLRSLGYITP